MLYILIISDTVMFLYVHVPPFVYLGLAAGFFQASIYRTTLISPRINIFFDPAG